MTIEELDLSVRSYNCLKRANINSVSELVQTSISDLATIRHFNHRCYAEVRLKLQSLGIDISSKNLYPELAKQILYGHAIGDALGVPVEFLPREELVSNPVTDFRGFGTHSVPAGTWSDDTSMVLATLDSLAFGLDYADIMAKFCSWHDDALYTATNEVFDIGGTTYAALLDYKNGTAPQLCGLCGERDNGNGSLMRILPAVFYIRHRMQRSSLREKLNVIHNISALTHRHLRSRIACGIYYFVLDALLDSPTYYTSKYSHLTVLDHFSRLFSDEFDQLPGSEINSSGYVVDTLEAAIWCLLTTDSYRDCVLKAVNLGNDTDTVGAVAGSLAGCLYYGCGKSDIPVVWKKKLLASEMIDELCFKFFSTSANNKSTQQGIAKKWPSIPETLFDLTVYEIEFGTCTTTWLFNNDILTLSDLLAIPLHDNKKLIGLGRRHKVEIETKLSELGIDIGKKS